MGTVKAGFSVDRWGEANQATRFELSALEHLVTWNTGPAHNVRSPLAY
jgi:hypothetical protein